MTLNGSVKVSDLVARFLEEKEMRHVFGIIGSGNAHLFDSIYQRQFSQMICVHHEQAACMAMQIYYRVSGVVTASFLTTGAGSTNGVTGVVSAWADSIPCLVISGNENSRHIRPDNPLRMYGVQGYDSPFMVSKVTKYAIRVMDPKMILFELEKAYSIATSGRPGPVWVDIPMNVQSAIVDEATLVMFDEATRAQSASKELRDRVSPADLESIAPQVLADLRAAERPVIWLGNGIRLAKAEGLLPALLEAVPAAFLVSWAGIDMIDSNHPRLFGRAGLYGQRCANFVVQNADYLLTIGTRLAIPQIGYEIGELARAAKIAVVDIDPAELGKYSDRFNQTICSDAGDFLRALLSAANASPLTVSSTDWLERCNRWRNEFPWVEKGHADRDGFLNSYPFMDRLNSFLKSDQLVVTDMGTALLSGLQVLRIRPGQRLMTSTGLGEMGFGLPAAIGASFARDRGEVLCLNCDGGMMMNLQELQTVAHHKLPIKLIIFNNDGYLMIKHTQKAVLEGRYSGTDRKSGVSCPDFSKLAAAFDMPAWQIRTWSDFDEVIPKIQEYPGPAICEVFMHPEQLFIPKLGLALQKDGSLVSPPLEDLSPVLPRQILRENMLIPIHPKSEKIES